MVGVLRVFQQADIQYVLAGELAEVLHGSPLLPVTCVVTIVPRVGQREPLSAAAATAGGKPSASPATSAIDAPARFALEAHGAELVIEPAPAATQGYDDLRRNAAAIQLAEDLKVTVASLVDLVRIAEACEDQARVPALRRTLHDRIAAVLPPGPAEMLDAARGRGPESREMHRALMLADRATREWAGSAIAHVRPGARRITSNSSTNSADPKTTITTYARPQTSRSAQLSLGRRARLRTLYRRLRTRRFSSTPRRPW